MAFRMVIAVACLGVGVALAGGCKKRESTTAPMTTNELPPPPPAIPTTGPATRASNPDVAPPAGGRVVAPAGNGTVQVQGTGAGSPGTR
jgi:hypothetical protein